LKIHLIIFPSTPVSPHWSVFLRFSHQNSAHASSLPIRATCPAHLIFLCFITCTILGEEYRPWSSSLWSFLHTPVIRYVEGHYFIWQVSLVSARRLA
jgi:hypothetical protein